MNADKLKYPERLCALLLAACLFAGGLFGARALKEYEYWRRDDWQETASFENLLHRYIDRAMILAGSSVRLKEEEDLTYMERQQLQNSVDEQQAELRADRTLFRYQVRAADGTVVEPGNLEGEEIKEAVHTVHYAPFPKYSRVPGEGVEFETYEDPGLVPVSLSQNQEDMLVIECGVPEKPEDFPTDDEFTRLFLDCREARESFVRDLYLAAGLLSAGGVILLAVLILSGRRAARENYVPSRPDRLWLELFLAAAGVTAGLCTAGLVLLGDLLHYNAYYIGGALVEEEILALAPWGAGGLLLLSGLSVTAFLRTVTVRSVSHTFASTCLLCRLAHRVRVLLAELSGAVPVLWRVVLGLGLLVGADLLAFTELNRGRMGFLMLLWGVIHGAALLFLCHWAACFRRLREGCRTIAAGNLNHRIDTAGMPRDLQAHGEDLNNISLGLSGAVEEKIKSERFKAELITNVSHDLKTPLTSIINYVNLLKTTGQTDPKALEYIEVLDRKSLRLKKLTEDLVEASKASTGVLTVNREKIGMSQLLSQALAEWEEKLTDRKLTVVTNLPEGETWVYADGRHLWRVIDNLLSNCCKYAMEGTRIYLDLKRNKGQVALEVKNISREPLNVPPEQLLERFVRGEESRSTEGSGLGLSIAKSLTELQGGTFELAVDGDLFKAVVSLTQAG